MASSVDMASNTPLLMLGAASASATAAQSTSVMMSRFAVPGVISGRSAPAPAGVTGLGRRPSGNPGALLLMGYADAAQRGCNATLPRHSPHRPAINPDTISVAAKPVGAPISG
jgi:hypothetical protein